ncbi:MAG: DNA primase large subunit PriL [Candidatus Bathyarchaeia archaeon]
MPSITELAKYPFMRKAAEYVKDLDLKMDELMTPQFSPILDRAKERVEQAIRRAEIHGWGQRDEIELLSFPAAMFIVGSLRKDRLTKRYALAEAKRAYRYLREEDLDTIRDIAEEFSWDLVELDEDPVRLGVHFADYLRNSIWIRESRWRLANRRVEGGRVILTRDECARLLQEEVRRRIEEKINGGVQVRFRDDIKPVLDELGQLCEALPSESIYVAGGEISLAAFPPCIKALYEDLASGRNVSHIGRFTLTSFLVNIGVSLDEVLKLFSGASDFDLEKTRYQVEHISGFRGAGRKYTPPKCATLRTHGLCANPDGTCSNMRHPLLYYKRKMGALARVKKFGS